MNRLLGIVLDVEYLFTCVHKEEDADTKQVYFYLFKVRLPHFEGLFFFLSLFKCAHYPWARSRGKALSLDTSGPRVCRSMCFSVRDSLK